MRWNIKLPTEASLYKTFVNNTGYHILAYKIFVDIWTSRIILKENIPPLFIIEYEVWEFLQNNNRDFNIQEMHDVPLPFSF